MVLRNNESEIRFCKQHRLKEVKKMLMIVHLTFYISTNLRNYVAFILNSVGGWVSRSLNMINS